MVDDPRQYEPNRVSTLRGGTALTWAKLPAVLASSLSRPYQFHNLAGVAPSWPTRSRATRSPEATSSSACWSALRGTHSLVMNALPDRQANWLRGVKDPIVGKGRPFTRDHRRLDRRLARGTLCSLRIAIRGPVLGGSRRQRDRVRDGMAHDSDAEANRSLLATR